MIFDIHCHILPSVDDGARNETSTDRMLRIAASEGIDVIVATPHFSYDREKEEVEMIKRKYAEVRALWKKRGADKEMYLGNELFYSEGVIEALQDGRALTMNGTRYVLVEFPMYAEFSNIQKAIQKLQYAGYIPIIAHVERYEYLRKKGIMQELVSMGAYMQVNASTIAGKHGIFAKHQVMKWIKQGVIHFVATDAHDSRERRPEINKCAAYLEKKLGVSKTHQLLWDNPMKMLKGEELDG